MKFLPIVSILLPLAACGSFLKSAPDRDAAPTGTYGELGLAGDWANDCVNREGGGSHRTRHAFAGDGATRIYTHYLLAGCRTGDEDLTYTATYANASKVTPSDLEGYATVRAELLSYVSTPITSEAVADFNANNRFGYADWQLGVPKDISGRPFRSDSTSKMTTGKSYYYTFAVAADRIEFSSYEGGQALKSTDPEDVFKRL